MKNKMMLAAVLAAAQAGSASATGIYEEFLMDAERETALARSAAPEQLSTEASIWLLGETGYYEAVEGTNGFHCMVLRSWSAPIISPDRSSAAQSWSQLVAPICYDRNAAEGDMQEQMFRARLALEGRSLDDIRAAVFDAYARGTLTPPRGVAFAYMMSGGQDLGPQFGAWYPHLMIYAPYETGEAFSNGFSSGLPVILEGAGTARAAFAVPLSPGHVGAHIAPGH